MTFGGNSPVGAYFLCFCCHCCHYKRHTTTTRRPLDRPSPLHPPHNFRRSESCPRSVIEALSLPRSMPRSADFRSSNTVDTTSNLRLSPRCLLRGAIATSRTSRSMPTASVTGATVSAAALVTSGPAALRAGARALSTARTRSVHRHNRDLAFQSNELPLPLDSHEPLEREGLSSPRRRRELWERLHDPWAHHLLHWPWLDPPNPPAWPHPRTLPCQGLCLWRLVSTFPYLVPVNRPLPIRY